MNQQLCYSRQNKIFSIKMYIFLRREFWGFQLLIFQMNELTKCEEDSVLRVECLKYIYKLLQFLKAKFNCEEIRSKQRTLKTRTRRNSESSFRNAPRLSFVIYSFQLLSCKATTLKRRLERRQKKVFHSEDYIRNLFHIIELILFKGEKI